MRSMSVKNSFVNLSLVKITDNTGDEPKENDTPDLLVIEDKPDVTRRNRDLNN